MEASCTKSCAQTLDVFFKPDSHPNVWQSVVELFGEPWGQRSKKMKEHWLHIMAFHGSAWAQNHNSHQSAIPVLRFSVRYAFSLILKTVNEWRRQSSHRHLLLRHLRQLKCLITSDAMEHLMAVMILSRLDYCNSVLAAVPWAQRLNQ